MNRSVTLDARQRQALLDRYRKDPDVEVRFRAHILLLLDAGCTWEDVGLAVLQLPHHRPLGQAVSSRGRGGRGRAQARPALSLQHRMARPRPTVQRRRVQDRTPRCGRPRPTVQRRQVQGRGNQLWLM